jgi:hypothetical protein
MKAIDNIVKMRGTNIGVVLDVSLDVKNS